MSWPLWGLGLMLTPHGEGLSLRDSRGAFGFSHSKLRLAPAKLAATIRVTR